MAKIDITVKSFGLDDKAHPKEKKFNQKFGFVAKIGEKELLVPIGFMRVSEMPGLERLLLVAAQSNKIDVDNLIKVLKSQHVGDGPMMFSSDQIRKAITTL